MTDFKHAPLPLEQAIDTAIHAYLAVLLLRVQEIEHLTAEACAEIATGQRNLAIGAMLPLERMLPECEALLRAALILHRMVPAGYPEGNHT
jgi:hypothetical protein